MSNGPIVGPAQAQATLQRALRGTELEALYRQHKPPAAPDQGINAIDSKGVNPIDSFMKLMETKVTDVNDVMATSDQKIQSFVRGEETSIHEVMIAMSKADLSFRLMTQVGRKVIEAYQEILRMQV
jgi:flagellar hook-basal body complex protein FliE